MRSFQCPGQGTVLTIERHASLQKIEIVDKDGSQKIIIDTANKKIEIQCGGDIAVKATGKLSFEANEVSIKAQGQMTLEAQGTTTIKGATVNIN